MAKDDLEHIPSITATRDSAPPPGKNRGKAAATPRRGGKESAGGGLLSRLLLTVSVAAAAVACAWAWQLQQALQASNEVQESYAQRISELEDRLSDTDEGLSQNTASMAVKIKELSAKAETNFQEIDKLWASAWRKNRDKIAALEKSSASHGSEINAAEKSLAALEKQVSGAATDLAKLKSVAGDMERLMKSARSNQAEVERLADEVNRLGLELSKLDKRVQGDAEWVAAVDAFRRQTIAALSTLKADIRAMQAAP
jgi:chromosome segregation ATPase